MYDSTTDPIAVSVSEQLMTPALARFSEMRQDATPVELAAASHLLIVLGVALVRFARLTARLDTAELAEGCDGSTASDFIFTATPLDTPGAREEALAGLALFAQPAAEAPTPSSKETDTTDLWPGQYL